MKIFIYLFVFFISWLYPYLLLPHVNIVCALTPHGGIGSTQSINVLLHSNYSILSKAIFPVCISSN